jgi:hypothetical protein
MFRRAAAVSFNRAFLSGARGGALTFDIHGTPTPIEWAPTAFAPL